MKKSHTWNDPKHNPGNRKRNPCPVCATMYSCCHSDECQASHPANRGSK